MFLKWNCIHVANVCEEAQRHGNKTVCCSIWPDSEMPYLTDDAYKDEYGVVQSRGPRERVDLITNSLAILNRTIPMALNEPSITFIMDRVRKHANKMHIESGSIDEPTNFMLDVLKIFHPENAKNLIKIYNKLSPKKQEKFLESCIGLDESGLIKTNKGLYVEYEAFNKDINIRDSIIEVYEKYGDIIKPYNIFVPKPKWGRDVFIGQDCVGYQYILLLKQSGESGFSVRSAGAISDESLPEKSHENKIGKLWHSETPENKIGKLWHCLMSYNVNESWAYFSNCRERLVRSILPNHISDYMVA